MQFFLFSELPSVSRKGRFSVCFVYCWFFQHSEWCMVHQKAFFFFFFASLKKKKKKPEWAVYKHTQSCFSRASPHLLTPREEEPREERSPGQQQSALRGRWQRPQREAQMGTVVSLAQSLLGVMSLWGCCAQCLGVVLKCPCMASWRLLDFFCSPIQTVTNLLARCLIASPWATCIPSNQNQ